MRLGDCADIIRSKNAGPFEISIDVIFPNADWFAAARETGLVDPAALADYLNVEAVRVLDVVLYPPAHAVKINLARQIPSGSAGDRDVYGTQQFVPLLDLDIPEPEVVDAAR